MISWRGRVDTAEVNSREKTLFGRSTSRGLDCYSEEIHSVCERGKEMRGNKGVPTYGSRNMRAVFIPKLRVIINPIFFSSC